MANLYCAPTKQVAPIIVPGAPGSFDEFWVAVHSIVKSASTFYAYYNAWNNAQNKKLGLATSTDGIAWTKYGTPVLPLGAPGAWDDGDIGAPCVWIENTTWYMLYCGAHAASTNYKIGLATSTDGVTWSKSESNPVFSPSSPGAWDSGAVLSGTCMLKEGSTYKLYYWGWPSGGFNTYPYWKIGLATSTDRITWTRHPYNPILAGGGADTWNVGVLEPHVLKLGDWYYMWYQGNAIGGLDDYSAVGVAISPDGVNWTKYPLNPVIPHGQPGDWDSNWAEAPILIEVTRGQWYLYYSGSRGSAATPRMAEGYGVFPPDFMIFNRSRGTIIG